MAKRAEAEGRNSTRKLHAPYTKQERTISWNVTFPCRIQRNGRVPQWWRPVQVLVVELKHVDAATKDGADSFRSTLPHCRQSLGPFSFILWQDNNDDWGCWQDCFGDDWAFVVSSSKDWIPSDGIWRGPRAAAPSCCSGTRLWNTRASCRLGKQSGQAVFKVCNYQGLVKTL